METVGDRYDNAMMESFQGTPQLETTNKQTWKTATTLPTRYSNG